MRTVGGFVRTNEERDAIAKHPYGETRLKTSLTVSLPSVVPIAKSHEAPALASRKARGPLDEKTTRRAQDRRRRPIVAPRRAEGNALFAGACAQRR